MLTLLLCLAHLHARPQVVSPTEHEEGEEEAAGDAAEEGEVEEGDEEQKEDEYDVNDDGFQVSKPDQKNDHKSKTTSTTKRTPTTAGKAKNKSTTPGGEAGGDTTTENVGNFKLNTDCKLGPVIFVPIPGLPLPLPVPLPDCKFTPSLEDQKEEDQYDQEEEAAPADN